MGAAPLALPRHAGAGGAGKIVMGMPTQPFRAGQTFSGRPSGPRGIWSPEAIVLTPPLKPPFRSSFGDKAGWFRFRSLLASSGPTHTKHQSGDSRKPAHSIDLDLSALSEM